MAAINNSNNIPHIIIIILIIMTYQLNYYSDDQSTGLVVGCWKVENSCTKSCIDDEKYGHIPGRS